MWYNGLAKPESGAVSFQQFAPTVYQVHTYYRDWGKQPRVESQGRKSRPGLATVGTVILCGAVFMSTSKLQRYTGKRLRARFGKYGLVENTRPDWLISSKGERLELDFFIDKLSIAIEVQGKQHFEFTPLFHESEWGFCEQQRRDREKSRICDRRGITLLYVCDKNDLEVIIAELYRKIESRLQSEPEEQFPMLYLRSLSGHSLQRLETLRGYQKGYLKRGTMKPEHLMTVSAIIANLEGEEEGGMLNIEQRQVMTDMRQILESMARR